MPLHGQGALLVLVLVLGVIDVSYAVDGGVAAALPGLPRCQGVRFDMARKNRRSTAKGRGGELKSTKANVRMRDIEFPSITHAQEAKNAGVDLEMLSTPLQRARSGVYLVSVYLRCEYSIVSTAWKVKSAQRVTSTINTSCGGTAASSLSQD